MIGFGSSKHAYCLEAVDSCLITGRGEVIDIIWISVSPLARVRVKVTFE